MYDPGLQRCQGIVQRGTNVTLDVVDQKGEAVPSLTGGERTPEDGLVLERDGSVVTRRVRQELGEVGAQRGIAPKLQGQTRIESAFRVYRSENRTLKLTSSAV